MNSVKSTTELKAESRELLIGKYRMFISVWLIMELILGIPSLTVSAFSSNTVISQLIIVLISILSELLAAVFLVGFYYFSLNVGLNRTYKINDIFYGLNYNPNHTILIQGILLLIDMIAAMPAIISWIVLYKIMPATPIFSPIILAIFTIIGAYLAIYFNLKYRFVFYILLDYKTATIKNIFRFSGELMKGNYLRLFYLYVTFLPYYLLSIFSFGIGFLFVIPYQQMTITNFYIDLIDCYYRETHSETRTETVQSE